jgi:membrane fusion protein (multidrug efflux system)
MMRNMTAKLSLMGLALGLCLLITAPEACFAQSGKRTVRAFRVGGVPPAQEVVGLGTVRCRKSLELGFPTTGVLAKVYVDEGDRVKKGQALAKLDDTVLKAELASKEAEVELARQKVAHLKDKKEGKEKLWLRKAISQTEYKDAVHLFIQAKTSLRQSKAQMRGLKARLGKMLLRAPLSGTVARRLAEAGEVVSLEQEPLLKLVSCERVLAEVSYGEKLYLRIKPGMPVLLTADALPGREFIGKVHAISPEVNDKDRTFKVKILADNPGRIMRPGMFVRAGLLRGKKGEPVWIPENAILAEVDGFGSVKLIKEGKTQLIKVKLGITKKGMVQITKGLKAGDMVMIQLGKAKKSQ